MNDENQKKEDSRTRKYRITIRMNEREYNALKKKKNWLKCSSLNDVIRMYIHSGVAYRFDYSAISDCLTQIGKIGNNINQIAHHNISGSTRSRAWGSFAPHPRTKVRPWMRSTLAVRQGNRG